MSASTPSWSRAPDRGRHRSDWRSALSVSAAPARSGTPVRRDTRFGEQKSQNKKRILQMRGRIILCLLGIALPSLIRAQVAPPKSKQDSIARADSNGRADSIALVKQLEKELGAPAADTIGAAAAA